MSDLTQAQVSLLFHQGVVSKWKIEQEAVSNDWLVSFQVGLSWSYLLDVRRKQIKRFKSLDAAISSLRFIGFDVKELKSCA